MSIFSSLFDVDIDAKGLLIDMADWAKEYALTEEAIEALSMILDNRIAFEKALKPMEAIDHKVFKGILMGVIKPEEEKNNE